MRKEEKLQPLTDQRRDTMSMDIYNISRRLRQLANQLPEGAPARDKMVSYVKQLNDIGTEIGGGVSVMIGKVLRS